MDPITIPVPFSPEPKWISKNEVISILQATEKPGRYSGGEFGIPEKSEESAAVKILFSYPDTYEIGMSNQGIKILYDRVNRNPDFLADRVFAPWIDFAEQIKNSDTTLWSLDRRLACTSFDAWGFNLSHELTFTNLLFMLDLAGVPLLRSERKNQDPIILAGGTAITNPLPVFDFLDGIFMGDGEEAIIEIAQLIQAGKKIQLSRFEIIESLKQVEGLVLPHQYESDKDRPGYVIGPSVKKRTFKIAGESFANLQSYPQASIQITQDRVVLEVARGCGQACRFCHAGFWKRPVRNSDLTCLLENAVSMLKLTGLDSISLHSLSLADYPALEELVYNLSQNLGPKGISLSLPSLRVDKRTLPVLESTAGIRKSSVTIALEAGSEYIRARIRKRSSEERLREMVTEIFSRGWDLVKVYFMLGLPDEQGNEADDVANSLNALGTIAKEGGQRKNINSTVSLFVPKPHTTFQWEELKSPEYFKNAINHVRDHLTSRRVRVKSPYPWMSYIEGIISRADTRMGKILLKAYKNGAIFDSWDDQFAYPLWKEIIEGLPPELLTEWTAKKDINEPLPWDIFFDGNRQGLIRDYEKFSKITPQNYEPAAPYESRSKREDSPNPAFIEMPSHMFETGCFLEITYSKFWPMIYISHLDTAEVIRRACRRVELPMAFSQGFNKHEKFHFGESLPLFFSSESETLYVDLREKIDTETFLKNVNQVLPEGLQIVNARLLENKPKPDKGTMAYRFEFIDNGKLQETIDVLSRLPESITFEKRDKKKKRKFGPAATKPVSKIVKQALQYQIKGSNIHIRLEHPDSGAISITDFLIKLLQIPAGRWNLDVVPIRESADKEFLFKE